MKGENLETGRCDVAKEAMCAGMTKSDSAIFVTFSRDFLTKRTQAYSKCNCTGERVVGNGEGREEERTHVGLHESVGRRKARSPNPGQGSFASFPTLEMLAP